MGRAGRVGGPALGAFVLFVACGSDRESGFGDPDPGGTGLDGGGTFVNEAGDPSLPTDVTRDPATCEEAKNSKSYVGCDYWPTVTANNVWSIFDFAAVVANTGTNEATITITGPSGTNKTVTVPSGELKKIYLPWVPALKGADMNQCGDTVDFASSVSVPNGAFHLVSSTPVIVYQFNALEYKGAGGESKDWSQCVGTVQTCPARVNQPARKIGCFSFTNDASLLLPSTAMTTNYRVVGQHGWSEVQGIFGELPVNGPTLTITATQPGTDVTLTLAPTARVRGGGSVPATNGGGTIRLALANAGDVVELVTEKGKQFDFSGSLVQSTKPVQVIAGNPCIFLPQGKTACDHIEETVLPAETLGRHYVIAPPTGPAGTAVKHNVRFYGNKDGTTLTYAPSKPATCPATLKAGEVVDCALLGADSAFEVTGTNEFAVAAFLLGATEIGAGTNRGDPSQTLYAAVEQFRTKYVFLAPDDYDVNFADITAAEGSEVQLDGVALSAPFTKLGNSAFGVYRVKLGAGKGGAHVLSANKAVGVQVIGYGANTSYQYPAGLNLNLIAPPPPPPK